VKFLQPKIFVALLVYILTMSPNACLVEQAIAAVVHSVPDSHDENESREQHASAPSHKHDEEGSENVFCCDNNLNLYLVNKSASQVDVCYQFISFIPQTAIVEKQAVPLRGEYPLHRFRQPTTLRGRDKYALTCLLHAPPQI